MTNEPKCPECGHPLEWENGGVGTSWEPGIVSTWYCPDCGTDFPNLPPPREAKKGA